jgi:hypothetical protein
VVAESVIREDDEQVSEYNVDTALNYRLFYQMSRITKDRGALAHDDRLDAVAGAVSYWIDHLAQDAHSASEKAKEKDWKRDIKSHLANQVDALTRPHRARKKARKDGFTLG